ncbi:hypothetical protein REPUB_Repub16aG0083300 [Reevesia pubescens]
MLWVDKYRPKSLDQVTVHQDIAQNLKKLVKVENRNWKIDAGSRTIDLELTTLSSTNHVELSPSDVGFQDRYIVQVIIKEMAKNRQIDTKGKKGYKVTEAIRSRCLNIRVNAPSEEQIVKVLEFIGKKEGLELPSGFAAHIAEKSNRSLRRAILSFETCHVQHYPFASNQAIPPMDWEEYISEIATDIMKEQSPKRLFLVRGKVYELLINCIPPEMVLKVSTAQCHVVVWYLSPIKVYFLLSQRLLHELLKKLDAELKHEVCHWAAYYEHRMRLGQKAIFHIEAFVAKFMSIYKAFLIATFG